MRKVLAIVVMASSSLAWSACSGGEASRDEDGELEGSAATSAASTSAADTDTTSGPPSTSVPEIDAADDIGDELFPGLGNAGYDVEHYSLDLTIRDPEILGRATIRATATSPLDSFSLDLHGLRVIDVTVDGASARFSRNGDELRVDPSQPILDGTRFTARVRYRGRPRPIADPVIPVENGWNRSDTGTYVINEPDGARTWFPSNDHPSDKATFAITLRTRSDIDVVANGERVSSKLDGEDAIVRYEMTDPMATYLVQVATGSFTLTEPVTSKSGIVVQHVVDRDLADDLAPALGRTAEMIDFFESRFGPYPFDRFGALVTRAEPGLALETQTLPIFDASQLTGDVDPFEAEAFLSHELSHEWFGNSVTPARWSEIWLNEGFATYAEYLWLERSYPGVLDSVMATTYDTIVTKRDEVGIPGSPTPESMFGPASYNGSAYVLYALRAEVGDRTFFRILRTWASRFSGRSVTTDDFVALASEVSGRDLQSFFDDWLYAETPPAAVAQS